MKIIIAGSRDFTNQEKGFEIIETGLDELGVDIAEITEIVEGGARGADRIGRNWAIFQGIEYVTFDAEWDNLEGEDVRIRERTNPWTKKKEKYNANAGFKRNKEMAEYADALITLTDGTSGTNNMKQHAENAGLKVYIYTKPDEDDEYVF